MALSGLSCTWSEWLEFSEEPAAWNFIDFKGYGYDCYTYRYVSWSPSKPVVWKIHEEDRHCISSGPVGMYRLQTDEPKNPRFEDGAVVLNWEYWKDWDSAIFLGGLYMVVGGVFTYFAASELICYSGRRY